MGTARAALSLRFIEVAASAQRLPKPSFFVIVLMRQKSAADKHPARSLQLPTR